MARVVRRIPIGRRLRRVLPAMARAAAAVPGTLLDDGVQRAVVDRLAQFAPWTDWVARARRPLSLVPFSVGPGFPVTPPMLVGLARALYPDLELSPYDVGPEAVTAVVARRGATARSHSENDLPAPPHTAAFFDDAPPLVAVFGCVRPHPGGGAETTIADVESILAALSPAHRRALRDRDHYYQTPRRQGSRRFPFRVLTTVHGLPFVRFRMDYTADDSEALRALDALVRNPQHQWVAPLAAGEVVFAFNGAPHGRAPQIGSTPADPGARRTLLRCRLRPRGR